MNSTKYDELIKKSINYPGKFSTIHQVYYEGDYFQKIIESLTKEGLRKTFSKEISGRFPHILSSASSARLCYLHFHKDFLRGDLTFEHLSPCLGNSNGVANLDAFMLKNGTKHYFECKCHEFVGTEDDVLLESYRDTIKKNFKIDSVDVITRQPKDKDKKPRTCLSLSEKQLGILIPGQEEALIYDMHFDVKQLICHLLGIAQEIENEKKAHLNLKHSLHYVFFVPSDKFGNKSLTRYYQTLETEIQAISKSKIQEFAKTQDISLDLESDFRNRIDVATVKDFVAEDLLR